MIFIKQPSLVKRAPMTELWHQAWLLSNEMEISEIVLEGYKLSKQLAVGYTEAGARWGVTHIEVAHPKMIAPA